MVGELRTVEVLEQHAHLFVNGYLLAPLKEKRVCGSSETAGADPSPAYRPTCMAMILSPGHQHMYVHTPRTI